MRLKKQNTNKINRTTFRSNDPELNKIKQKANIYCEGNLSEYVLYAALHFVPGKEDFEIEEKPPKKRRRK